MTLQWLDPKQDVRITTHERDGTEALIRAGDTDQMWTACEHPERPADEHTTWHVCCHACYLAATASDLVDGFTSTAPIASDDLRSYRFLLCDPPTHCRGWGLPGKECPNR